MRQLENYTRYHQNFRTAGETGKGYSRDRPIRTYRFLERGQAYALLLLSLHRVIEQDPRPQNMDLPLVEDFDPWKKRAVRVFERIWQAEPEDETTGYREGTHKREQPEPPRLATYTTHVEDAEGQKLRRGLAELVSEVEEHDALGRLLPRVPGRQRPETAWDEA